MSAYSQCTLVGNWYETRLDTAVADPPELARTGRHRVTPIQWQRPVSQPFTSQYQRQYTPKHSHPPPQPVRMIHTESKAISGVTGPVVPVIDNAVSHWSTSSHTAHGGKFAADVANRQMLPLIDWTARSTATAAPHDDHGKRCFGASGEQVTVGPAVDAKRHTFVQRSWLPTRQFDHYNRTERFQLWHSDANTSTRSAGEVKTGTRINGTKEMRRDRGIWLE